MRPFLRIFITGIFVLFCGCTGLRDGLFLHTPEMKEVQAQESRTYPECSEQRALLCAAGVLQDMGYRIGAGSSHYGVISASILRKAEYSYVKRIASSLISFGLSFAGLSSTVPFEREQSIVSMITATAEADGAVRVCATFARVLYLSNGKQRIERITDAQVYQIFFKRLDQWIQMPARPGVPEEPK